MWGASAVVPDPPLMAKLAQFNKLVADFSQDVEFLTVYVHEAHAADKWAITNTLDYEINDHKNIDDRLAAAKLLHEIGLSGSLVMDLKSNNAAVQYGVPPESLFVIEDGTITLKALGPFAYDPPLLRKFLQEQTNKQQ